MNLFTIHITKEGFTETLSYRGVTIAKRYVKNNHGYEGKDVAWDSEDLPEELICALEGREPDEIMDILNEEWSDDEDEE